MQGLKHTLQGWDKIAYTNRYDTVVSLEANLSSNNYLTTSLISQIAHNWPAKILPKAKDTATLRPAILLTVYLIPIKLKNLKQGLEKAFPKRRFSIVPILKTKREEALEIQIFVNKPQTPTSRDFNYLRRLVVLRTKILPFSSEIEFLEALHHLETKQENWNFWKKKLVKSLATSFNTKTLLYLEEKLRSLQRSKT